MVFWWVLKIWEITPGPAPGNNFWETRDARKPSAHRSAVSQILRILCIFFHGYLSYLDIADNFFANIIYIFRRYIVFFLVITYSFCGYRRFFLQLSRISQIYFFTISFPWKKNIKFFVITAKISAIPTKKIRDNCEKNILYPRYTREKYLRKNARKQVSRFNKSYMWYPWEKRWNLQIRGISLI